MLCGDYGKHTSWNATPPKTIQKDKEVKEV